MEPINIVMVTCNALDYTRMAIDSLSAYTRYPYVLTVVDNASTDGTQDYLRQVSLKDGSRLDTRLILNEQNLRYGPAIVQGHEAVETSRVCVVNNDVVFSPGWLTEMVAVMNNDPTIGILGPLRPGPFCVHPYNGMNTNRWINSLPNDLSAQEELSQFLQGEITRFASDVVSINSRDFDVLAMDSPPNHIVTCCALIDSEKALQVGGLADERFPTCEDTDFSWRIGTGRNIDGQVTTNPAKIAVTSRTYVHHAKHKSYNTIGDRKTLDQVGAAMLYDVWGDVIRNYISKQLREGVDVEEKMSSEVDWQWWTLRRLNETVKFWSEGRVIDPTVNPPTPEIF